MTSSFLMLVISLISLREDRGQVPGPLPQELGGRKPGSTQAMPCTPGGGPGSLDGNLWPLPALRLQSHQDLQDGLGPVASVGQEAKVREGLLRGPRFPFHFGELIT